MVNEPSGLSPRVRGEPPMQMFTPWRNWVYPRACGGTLHHGNQPHLRGSIPARAGEPRGPSLGHVRGEPPMQMFTPWRNWVYPRACGGTLHHGNQPHLRGSIPARAGEPRGPSLGHVRGEPPMQMFTPWRNWVYPRACGGTLHHGNQPHLRGSIPARAGEPRGPSLGHDDAWVYPRACGGNRPC